MKEEKKGEGSGGKRRDEGAPSFLPTHPSSFTYTQSFLLTYPNIPQTHQATFHPPSSTNHSHQNNHSYHSSTKQPLLPLFHKTTTPTTLPQNNHSYHSSTNQPFAQLFHKPTNHFYHSSTNQPLAQLFHKPTNHSYHSSTNQPTTPTIHPQTNQPLTPPIHNQPLLYHSSTNLSYHSSTNQTTTLTTHQPTTPIPLLNSRTHHHHRPHLPARPPSPRQRGRSVGDYLNGCLPHSLHGLMTCSAATTIYGRAA
ncbi:hypothetical protein Pcinc_044481 [Petrolisthes cinctipes]|uniref:Uncharacterized protein n=1 Tax=Petrolisthes cinctipes TaxID=88211 RepID=A0AAE1BH10_PETCI|nr:hypothetical protein Pcinc_044481 [Petrolisthes cinctipes]